MYFSSQDEFIFTHIYKILDHLWQIKKTIITNGFYFCSKQCLVNTHFILSFVQILNDFVVWNGTKFRTRKILIHGKWYENFKEILKNYIGHLWQIKETVMINGFYFCSKLYLVTSNLWIPNLYLVCGTYIEPVRCL